jgi:hypothetical protein
MRNNTIPTTEKALNDFAGRIVTSAGIAFFTGGYYFAATSMIASLYIGRTISQIIKQKRERARNNNMADDVSSYIDLQTLHKIRLKSFYRITFQRIKQCCVNASNISVKDFIFYISNTALRIGVAYCAFSAAGYYSALNCLILIDNISFAYATDRLMSILEINKINDLINDEKSKFQNQEELKNLIDPQGQQPLIYLTTIRTKIDKLTNNLNKINEAHHISEDVKLYAQTFLQNSINKYVSIKNIVGYNLFKEFYETYKSQPNFFERIINKFYPYGQQPEQLPLAI